MTPDKPKKKMRPTDLPGDFTETDKSALNWLAGAVRTLYQKMSLLGERISACEEKAGQMGVHRDEAEAEIVDVRIESVVADFATTLQAKLEESFRDVSDRLDNFREEFDDYTAKLDDLLEPLEQRLVALEQDSRANASASEAAGRPGTRPAPSPMSSMPYQTNHRDNQGDSTARAKFDPVMVESLVKSCLASMKRMGRRQRDNYLSTLQKNARMASSDKQRADAEEVCRRLMELSSTW